MAVSAGSGQVSEEQRRLCGSAKLPATGGAIQEADFSSTFDHAGPACMSQISSMRFRIVKSHQNGPFVVGRCHVTSFSLNFRVAEQLCL